MNNKTFLPHKQFLFCPGPVNVSENVKEAVVANEIGHREKEFLELLKELNERLLMLFEVKNPRLYQSIIITGSGTAANEAILSSVVGNQYILILSNGEFGERLYEISKMHNAHTYLLKFPWAEKIDLAKVEAYLKHNKVDIISMVHHETSTGMLNPIEKIGKMTKKYHVRFLVDAVSSAGAEKIDLKNWNISFCSSSAAKAIGSLPGISFVIGKKSEFEKLKEIPAKTAYLNLYKFYYYARNLKQTPNTPAIQLFYALNQAIENILHKGIASKHQDLKQNAALLRSGMKKLGLLFLLDEEDMSCVLTTVIMPDYIPFDFLKNKLREKNIIIYNGKGPLINKVFQVGNIGNVSEKDIIYFLKTLKEVLIGFMPILSTEKPLFKSEKVHLQPHYREMSH